MCRPLQLVIIQFNLRNKNGIKYLADILCGEFKIFYTKCIKKIKIEAHTHIIITGIKISKIKQKNYPCYTNLSI